MTDPANLTDQIRRTSHFIYNDGNSVSDKQLSIVPNAQIADIEQQVRNKNIDLGEFSKLVDDLKNYMRALSSEDTNHVYDKMNQYYSDYQKFTTGTYGDEIQKEGGYWEGSLTQYERDFLYFDYVGLASDSEETRNIADRELKVQLYSAYEDAKIG